MADPAPDPSRDPPRSLTTTLAPSRARVRAYSRPRPPPAPVTTMTRSCTPGITFLSSVFGDETRVRARCRALEELARQLPRLLCIRRVDQRAQVGSGWLRQHGFLVAELLEAE